MVIEFADIPTVGITQSQRSWFRANQHPPDGWKIWMGPYAGKRWCGTFWHTGFGVYSDPPGPPPNGPLFNGQTTMFAAGGVIFQTAFSPENEPLAVLEYPPSFGVFRLWPPPNQLRLDPAFLIDEHHALNLAIQIRNALNIPIDQETKLWIMCMP